MALVRPFRAPQPKGYYPFPGAVSRDGLTHGYVTSRNVGNFANFAILTANFFPGAGPFGVGAPLVGSATFAIVRFGKRYGAVGLVVPPVP